MNQSFYTYLHLRPDGVPFYAGKGKGKRAHVLDGRGRWYDNVAKKHSVSNIIVRKVKQGLTEAEAFAHEIEMIACLRSFNYAICNVTNGGEGASGCIHGAEVRAKMSAARIGNTNSKGFVHSAETRAKMSASLKGKVVSTATREKLSVAGKGKVIGVVAREKLAAAMTGRIASPATRAKMSAAHKGHPAWNKGKPTSDEVKLKLSIASKGKPKSAAQCAKLSRIKTGNQYARGRIWITDGTNNKTIPPAEMPTFETLGWKRGITKAVIK